MLRSSCIDSHRSWWRSHAFRNRVTPSARHRQHNLTSSKTLLNCRVYQFPVYSLPYQGQQSRWASSAVAATQARAAAERDLTRRLLQFRYNLNDAESAAVQSYEDYIEQIPLEPKDTLQLLQQLHKGVWTKGLLARKTEKGWENLRNLLGHYTTGRLPPSPGASTVLLSICRDCEAYEAGIEFWAWAEQQGSSMVALSTYGAAIDLHAAASQDLEICEDIFQSATQILTAGFNRYLLSPNAVLSNPQREITSTGVSTSLLASIANARLHSGSWIDGYMAIDSILRLKPDRVPPRLLRFVMEERSVEEALRLFRLICLGGSKVPEGAIVRLYDLLRQVQSADLRSPGDRHHHIFLASLAQINLLHVAIASGQSFHPALPNMIFMGTLVNLPSAIDATDTESVERFSALATRLRDSVLKLCTLAGMPHAKAEYAMLRAASILRNRQLFESTLEASQRGVHFPFHLHAPIYEAALRFADEKLLHQAFVKMGVESRNRSFKRLVQDLVLQSRSTEELGACRAFYLGRYPDASQNHGDKLLASMVKAQNSLRSRQPPPVESSAALKRQETRILGLIERLDLISELMASSEIRNLDQHPLPALSLHKSLGTVPEPWQRELYEEMHIEPLSRRESYQKKSSDQAKLQQGVAVRPSPEFLLPTGIPYEEARFQLFSGMNEIFLLARGLERGPPKRDRRGHLKTATERLEALQTSASMHFDSVQAWKSNIRSLRGVEGHDHQSDASHESERERRESELFPEMP